MLLTKEEARQEWIRRLESGEIKQAKGYLGFIDNSRCCLGVACDIAVENGIIPKPNIDTDSICKDNLVFADSIDILPPEVVKYFDFVGDDPYIFYGCSYSKLSVINDSGVSFKNIAKLVKDRYKDIFIG